MKISIQKIVMINLKQFDIQLESKEKCCKNHKKGKRCKKCPNK